jgi:hypothetical protein
MFRNAESFLCDALSISKSSAKALWAGLKDDIWMNPQRPVGEAELSLFLQHGLKYDIGVS